MNRKTKQYVFYAIVVFIICVIVAIIFYPKFSVIDISAENLAHKYAVDKMEADKELLDKNVEVSGTVKAYYTLLGARKVLELDTDENDPPVICFFLNSRTEEQAKQLQIGEQIIVDGKCVGTDVYNYVRGVKIEVEEIEQP